MSNMKTSSPLFVWLICIGIISFPVIRSAIMQNPENAERCRRLSNELDKNTIKITQTECNTRTTLHDYFRDRQDLLNYEVETSFGADIKLSNNEQLANKIIMQAKEDEFEIGFRRPYTFNPARHIFEVFDVIKQSKLFQIIKKMPKGGILHAHDTALCTANYVVSLTYWPNLWQQTITNGNIEFKFSREPPTTNSNKNIGDTPNWRLVKDVRNEMGAEKYDEYIRTMFTLYDKNIDPKIQFNDINAVWNRFMSIFIRIEPLITYAPVWKDYFKNALKEIQADGVQYLEFRGILPKVYFNCE